jgi:hypothetical protein
MDVQCEETDERFTYATVSAGDEIDSGCHSRCLESMIVSVSDESLGVI